MGTYPCKASSNEGHHRWLFSIRPSEEHSKGLETIFINYSSSLYSLIYVILGLSYVKYFSMNYINIPIRNIKLKIVFCFSSLCHFLAVLEIWRFCTNSWNTEVITLSIWYVKISFKFFPILSYFQFLKKTKQTKNSSP